MGQAISSSHVAEQETDSESESDQEQLDRDVLPNMKSDNE